MKLISLSVISSWIVHIIASDVSEQEVTLLRVRLNDRISLICNMTDRYEIGWFHQHSQQLTQLICAKTSSAAGRKLLVTHNQNSNRLEVTADTGITAVSLVISGVTETDLGLYFCGTKSVTSELHFETPVRLQLEDEPTEGENEDNSVTDPPKDVEITDEVTDMERMLMFGGVGLAVFVFFLATVVAGRIIHHDAWQKGWSAAKRSSLSHKSAL